MLPRGVRFGGSLYLTTLRLGAGRKCLHWEGTPVAMTGTPRLIGLAGSLKEPYELAPSEIWVRTSMIRRCSIRKIRPDSIEPRSSIPANASRLYWVPSSL